MVITVIGVLKEANRTYRGETLCEADEYSGRHVFAYWKLKKFRGWWFGVVRDRHPDEHRRRFMVFCRSVDRSGEIETESDMSNFSCVVLLPTTPDLPPRFDAAADSIADPKNRNHAHSILRAFRADAPVAGHADAHAERLPVVSCAKNAADSNTEASAPLTDCGNLPTTLDPPPRSDAAADSIAESQNRDHARGIRRALRSGLPSASRADARAEHLAEVNCAEIAACPQLDGNTEASARMGDCGNLLPARSEPCASPLDPEKNSECLMAVLVIPRDCWPIT